MGEFWLLLPWTLVGVKVRGKSSRECIFVSWGRSGELGWAPAKRVKTAWAGVHLEDTGVQTGVHDLHH
jgi:hypothetical protein